MSNWEVGLVHELCPICKKQHNEQIIIPQKLTKQVADEIKEANGKAIGFSSEPCEECQENIDTGYTYLVEIDLEKSTGMSLTEVWYTGNAVWMRNEKIYEIFGSDADTSKGMIFVETGVFDKIGITQFLKEHSTDGLQTEENRT